MYSGLQKRNVNSHAYSSNVSKVYLFLFRTSILFFSSPLWLLWSAPVVPLLRRHSRWTWPPCIPPWPGSSSRTWPAGTGAWARPPPCKSEGCSSSGCRTWQMPKRRLLPTRRTPTPKAWSWCWMFREGRRVGGGMKPGGWGMRWWVQTTTATASTGDTS